MRIHVLSGRRLKYQRDSLQWIRLFNLGLLRAFKCFFSYYKNSKTGTLLVLIGTLVIYIGGGWINVLGYIILTIGFYINLYTSKHKKPPPKAIAKVRVTKNHYHLTFI